MYQNLIKLPHRGNSVVARNLANLAERNLSNLALQAVHECRIAPRKAEREQIAAAGLAISQARNLMLRHVLETK